MLETNTGLTEWTRMEAEREHSRRVDMGAVGGAGGDQPEHKLEELE